jgi:uncharacterized protein (TIGR00297 family)
LTRSELGRKVVHIGVGHFALLLRWLAWPQAALMALGAFVFNWQVLPRLGGRGLWRAHEHGRGHALGILIYPLSVLGVILLFRHHLWMAAAIWGILAWGDGMASVVGQVAGGPRLPWNAQKGWMGSAAFVAFGALGAAAFAGWTLGLPPASWLSPRVFGLTTLLALCCALVESLPTTLDDNLTVPLTAALVLPLLDMAAPALLLTRVDLGERLLWGLAINAAIALLAFVVHSIDALGALSAIVIGTAITVGLGLPGLAVMVAFFVIGTAATKIGYRVKAARGIAQEKGGARGWRNAWANGGVPALLALLAGLHEAPETRLLLTLAYAAAVATAAADTCSSEVGKAYGRRTFLITTLRPVPPGTEGAVSLEGTLGGMLGGFIVAAVGASLGLFSWPVAGLVGLAGLLGSLAESVVGTVAEREGWMGNDALNALNTAMGAGLAVLLVHIT